MATRLERLSEAIVTLMAEHGETGVLRAVTDEIDRRLARAMGEEQRLRKKLEALDAGDSTG